MINKKLNGVTCYAPKSREELINYAFDKKSILVAVNAEKILHATNESRSIINRNLGYPDGIGAVWALKSKGIQNVVKIPGCELWLDIVHKYEKTKRFCLIGGKEEIINRTITKLKAAFPAINIVHARNGYLKDSDEIALINTIKITKPDIVFVAMGSPKQEFLMERIQKEHPAVYQGLGGSFDVYVGEVNRAPKWWVKNNLEWAYRLIKQPTRIKRQFHLIKFFYLLKMKKL